MLDIIKNRKVWYILSGLIMAAAIVSLAIYGLKLGLDFKGGSLAELKFEKQDIQINDIQTVLSEQNLGATSVQATEDGTYLVRTPELSQEQHANLLKAFNEKQGPTQEVRYESIGPTISGEVTRRAFYQLLLVSLGILSYIAWAFRKVPRPLSSWRFGWAAIIALVHDLLVVVGVFALLGHFMNVEIDALFVTALLTVLGFSVHDTIIVFDRIRENLRKLGSANFGQVVTRSINQTLVRSINTSTTVVFVLLALLLFGGESIKYFVLALLVGVVAGTYSSIFLASPLLYDFHKKRLQS